KNNSRAKTIVETAGVFYYCEPAVVNVIGCSASLPHMICERVPAIWRVTEPEELRSFLFDASCSNVVTRGLAFVAVIQLKLKKFSGPFIQTMHRVAISRDLLVVFGLVNNRNRNAALLGDDANSFRKTAAFDSHHEIKDAATNAATETLEESFARMNVERRSLFGMKRAARQIVCATLLEGDIVGNYTHNVALILDVVSKAARQMHLVIQS